MRYLSDIEGEKYMKRCEGTKQIRKGGRVRCNKQSVLRITMFNEPLIDLCKEHIQKVEKTFAERKRKRR